MTQGAIFTLGMLIEKEKAWARSINQKNDGKLFKVLKSWKSKKALPIYQDIALHKVVKDMWGIEVPKTTISAWLRQIPELLADSEEVEMLLEDKKEEIKVVADKDKKYTYEEWEYLHNKKGEALLNEQKGIIAKLSNPNLSDKEIMRLTGISQRAINKINNYGITMSDKDLQTRLINSTGEIIEKGLEKISKEINKVGVHKAQDLKAITGAVSDVFNMNRLLKGESTENIGIGPSIMAKIHEKTAQKEKQRIASKKIAADLIIKKTP